MGNQPLNIEHLAIKKCVSHNEKYVSECSLFFYKVKVMFLLLTERI